MWGQVNSCFNLDVAVSNASLQIERAASLQFHSSHYGTRNTF